MSLQHWWLLMTKIFRSFLLLLSCLLLNAGSLSAETTVEVRSDAFLPAAHRFSDVYGKCRVSIGVEASTSIYEYFDLWMGYDQFNKKGHVLGCGNSKINLSTFSGGLKKSYCFHSRFIGYLGIGFSVADVIVKNWVDPFSMRSHKTSFGGVLKSGAYIFVTEHVFFDLFADYYYQPIHYHYTTNCGGFRLGIGLGVSLF
ncbi:MAG: hypothetical protein LBC45_02435 [Chlamydiales bacterium]|nr:hypothetical protein [Chlamydiales bacterium]